jgi:hypothetical protein
MTREDFRIVQKYYTTSSLVMIFHGKVIIESVEIYKNYSTYEDAEDKAKLKAEYDKLIAAGKKPKAIKQKPVKMKLSKDKRTESEISAECENKIKKYIAAYGMITT